MGLPFLSLKRNVKAEVNHEINFNRKEGYSTLTTLLQRDTFKGHFEQP